MTETENKNILQKLVSENPFKYGSMLKTEKYKFLMDWILENTSELSSEIYNIKTKIYWVLNDIKSFSDSRCCCKVCHKPLIGKNVASIKDGYRYCSTKCSNNIFEKIEKLIESNKQRIKVTKPLQMPKIEFDENAMLSDFIDFLNSLGIVVPNSPFDGFFSFPEKKIAINFVEFSKAKSFEEHDLVSLQNKCLENNFRSIFVFEDEWMLKRKIVESRLENILGKTSRKIPARKCVVKEISFNESANFLEENHLQGKTPSSKFNLGLFFCEELISVMTFSIPRYSNHEWELLRFCNKIGTSVIGGASKLFKEFLHLKNPKSVVSYADRRWSEGNLYENLNFKLEHFSQPNYFYFNEKTPLIRESRVKYQKHKLKEQLHNFDSSLTEKQNMKNNGFFWVHDCGNFVYVYEN